MSDPILNAITNLALLTVQENVGYQASNPDGSQVPAFLFHIEGENTASLDSDITDHYTEENDPIQDQIALRPEVVTVHGFIGELNDIPSGQFVSRELAELSQVIPPGVANLARLPILSAFSPALTTTATNLFNSAFQAYQNVASEVNAAGAAWSSLVNGSPGLQTKQSVMFNQFATYRAQRLLFRVQTPWAIFTDMAILSLKSTQDSDTRMITDFFVTFKRIRKASVPSPDQSAVKAGRLAAMAALPTDSGTNNLTLGPSLVDKLAAQNFPAVF